jgi:hypothetical protein
VIQLRLWSGRYPWSPTLSLLARIRFERDHGIEVEYHFNGTPLPIGRA